MGDTTIEWTEKTWNPTRGCSIASPGCHNCYAMGIAARFSGPGKPFEGYAKFSGKRRLAQWTGKLGLVEGMLGLPLTWKTPHHVFVNSMSDLFHEKLSNEAIAAVFGVMAASPQHTFQVLTKRAPRMREWFAWVEKRGDDGVSIFPDDPLSWRIGQMLSVALSKRGVSGYRAGTRATGFEDFDPRRQPWPLPNVWLGVSVESQGYADERIPELLATPAAMRFVSYEPALGPVDFERFLKWTLLTNDGRRLQHPDPAVPSTGGTWERCLDWVIVGGESGRGARPFDVRWAESVVAQCRAADVPVFVKQLGAKPYMSPDRDGGTGYELALRHPKGGDPAEWPASVRVRQFPRSEVSRG